MPDGPAPAIDQPARWIDTEEQFSRLVAELADQPRLAIDTEFHRERTYWPVCALVQIGWAPGPTGPREAGH